MRVASFLPITVIALSCASTVPHTAYAQQSRARLSEAIKEAPVEVMPQAAVADVSRFVVNPQVVAAATNVTPPPENVPPVDATPAPTPEPTETPVDVAPAAANDSAVEAPRRLARGQLYFVRLPPQQETAAREVVAEQVAAAALVEAGTVQSFEGVVRQVTDADVEVQLKPYVLVGEPLKFVEDAGWFAGSVAIGVADLIGGSGQGKLSAPLLFQVLETREQKSLDHVSPPYEYIDVSTEAAGRPVTLRIASNFSREGIAVTIPVEPTLLVEIDNDNLRGLGIQTTRVTVRAVGGTETPTGTVSLSARGAFLDDDAPEFDPQGLAHAELRSDSPGRVVVRATATGYTAGAMPVTILWPWQTLTATLVGGVIGGFLRLGSRIRRNTNWLHFVIGLIIAALTGVLVFALYVLGVKLLPVTFGVEVGDLFAFAAAALGGWLGTGVLPKLAPASD
jgi:hypothetical protein